MAIELVITPAGRLAVDVVDGVPEENTSSFSDEIKAAFDQSSARGLLNLASRKPSPSWQPPFMFWRDFAIQYLSRLCQSPGLDAAAIDPIAPPEDSELDRSLEQVPPMQGLEYLNRDALKGLWASLDELTREEIEAFDGTAREYIKVHHPLLHLLGRVTFHLAENKRDPESPFAFMATYTHRISNDAKLQHLPLARALKEYSGAQNRHALLSLLEPVKRAGEQSGLVRELTETGDLFHPLAWSPGEAHRFLKDIPVFEQSGIVVRLPDWWKRKGPSRPQVRVAVGNQPSNLLGMDSMLDFSVKVTLNGESLSKDEIESILQSSQGLVLLKGQWVEVDRDQLYQVLDHWTELERNRSQEGLSFIEGMRLLSGASLGKSGSDEELPVAREWSTVAPGEWLQKVLEEMRDPRLITQFTVSPDLKAELRAYQEDGVKWMGFMCRLGLGSCLADDMGLGKTIQVLALLLQMKHEATQANSALSALLVLPASLIGNWLSEVGKFAPTLKVFVAHPSRIGAEDLSAATRTPDRIQEQYDLVITTYSLVHRQEWLNEVKWRLIILDEAQAIKNPSTRQTRAIKKLTAQVRIALTGTPVENRLGDLWSVFDFICPGLLGTAKVFSQFTKTLSSQTHPDFTPLRALVKPYILRRLKTDRTIIKDLPNKTELRTFCCLTKKQAVLYQHAVDELAQSVESAEGVQRRGIILSYILRFKQICNHPSQWLNEDEYAPEESGKFQRLTELCELIASKQEKALVFTQFRQIAEPLGRFLSKIFRRPGLILHGGTPVHKRQSLVEAFQEDHGPPFFILSVKAGGTGLNLTAASHVIHFDRWWNPAVENQATDRAFRIGQRKNVLVHKLVCQGTIEERIDAMIEDKKGLARDVLEEGGETMLTEMNNEQLMKFVSLDINSAMQA